MTGAPTEPVRRRPDGSVITPDAREPSCVHSDPKFPQPMSACRVCKDSDRLAYWRRQWDAYVAENPDSEAARWRRAQEGRSAQR